MISKPFRVVLWVLVGCLVVGAIGTGWAQEPPAPTEPSGAGEQPGSTPVPVLDMLEVTRRFESPSVADAQQRVVIELRGQNRPDVCWGAPVRPVDVMLVFDTSSSAGVGPGSNWDQTQQLASTLFTYMQRPIYRQAELDATEQSRIGMITSQTVTTGTQPIVLAPLTTEIDALAATLQAQETTGDTDLQSGLRKAGEELGDAATPNRARAVLLMLHDSVAITEGAATVVRELQSRGIEVYAVVNSANISAANQLDRQALERLSVDGAFIDPDPRALYDLFLQMSGGSATIAARSVQITETISPAGIVEPFDVSSGGNIVDETRIVWNLNNPVEQDGQNATQELSYHLRAAGDVIGRVSFRTQVRFIDCNGYVGEIGGEPRNEDIIGTREGATATPVGGVPGGSNGTNEPGTVGPGGLNGGLGPELPSPEDWPWLIPWWVWPLLLLGVLLLVAAFYSRRRNRQPRTNGPGAAPALGGSAGQPPPPVSPPREVPRTPILRGPFIDQGWEEAGEINGMSITTYRRQLIDDRVQKLTLQESESGTIPVVKISRSQDKGRLDIVGKASCSIKLVQDKQLDPITGNHILWLAVTIRTGIDESVDQETQNLIRDKLNEHAQKLLQGVTWTNGRVTAQARISMSDGGE